MTAAAAPGPHDPPRGNGPSDANVPYGFIGLGQMGAPMARHLTGRGLVVHDTRPEAVAPLVDGGARAAASPAEVAAACRIISIMVRDDAQVDEVAAGILPAAAPGTILAVHSTIRPGTAQALAERARPYRVEVVDAPVSGGFMGAEAGTLAVMVGGAEEAFARCREPFGAWADLVLHMGPVGAGTRAKLARNLLHFTAFAAAAEAQRLAEAAGISLRRLARVVRHSDAVTGGPGAIMIRPATAPLGPGDPLYGIMEHVLALGEKDLSLALDLAAEHGVDTPLARLALARLADGLGLPARMTTTPEETR
ncbi:NAD(P)-dependent oxidoreductase [Planomonospora venezuelensis]|uniref:3-hydroxyisobutyrate dehydrogenase-like beta-hydroxyacid dehydrogenase n=1 Tax=Planomonospora venezuelensis TaxID=1999 RepID=A0A841D1Y6_PLAVE|nr:NAD(P)-dependent oxidoreductase [Planomonospora venezuelensis]MBB5961526.1 3-hydroxyisobutyrate dehydrogenase-like beta-hydroxyacid dehydrogenase [Planomonospora venezuelensis]GIM98670.1 putative oxidoreductase [Planomonospora venezuelensis]